MNHEEYTYRHEPSLHCICLYANAVIKITLNTFYMEEGTHEGKVAQGL